MPRCASLGAGGGGGGDVPLRIFFRRLRAQWTG